MADQEQSRILTNLALENFSSDLSEAETAVLSFAVGNADLKWPPHDTGRSAIRGEFLRWLLTDRDAFRLVHAKGIRICSAIIEGPLDLADCNIPMRFALMDTEASDKILLDRAEIRNISLIGCRLLKGLSARGALIKGSVTFHGSDISSTSSKFYGPVSFTFARISGQLDCCGSLMAHEKTSLDIRCAKIDGSVLLRSGFGAKGDVKFLSAQVSGDLDCSAGEMPSLDCQRARVGGNILLRNGCTVQKFVDLTGAQIGGSLDFSSGSFHEVRCRYTEVKGDINWTSLKGASNTELWLGGANVRSLFDDQVSWPAKGKLHLSGFTYKDLINLSGAWAGAKYFADRIDWLHRQPDGELYLPQPWNELAKLAEARGDNRSARYIMHRLRQLHARISSLPMDPITAYFSREGVAARGRGLTHEEMKEHLRTSLKNKRALRLAYPILLLMDILRLGERAAKWLFAYLRHQPLLIVIPIALATLAGTSVFHMADDAKTMAPTEPHAYAVYSNGPSERSLPDGYQPFSPTTYALENILPLVRLGQADKWAPDPDPKHGQRYMLTSYAFLSKFRWMLILTGYALATILATAIAGKFKD